LKKEFGRYIQQQIKVNSLFTAYCRYGDVGDVYIPRIYGSGDPKGYAFVRFHDLRDAEDAMKEMDGKSIDERAIRVQMATRKRPDDPRGHYASRG
jgi:splicing factor, arginine/serine-rich 2